MIRLGILGFVLFGTTMAALSLHVPGALSVGSIQTKTWFVEVTGVSTAVYLLAVLTILLSPRQDLPCHVHPRHADEDRHPRLRFRPVWIVLLIAAAMRLPLIVSPPFLSTDVYRYVWDGRVSAAGNNPYRYMPADPALSSLRDNAVYPHINRAEYAPTIYAPAAELIFATIGYLWSSVTAVKATMVGFEILAMTCLLRMLAGAGLPGERLLIYAWNPLPVWAFAGNGHIDAAAIGLVSLALLSRVRHRDGWAGVAIGLAILTKFLPAVVAPVLWRARAGWRTASAAVATILLLYALYSGVGPRVFGFLQGYGSEEGYDTGEGFWLLAALQQLTPLTWQIVIAYKVCLCLLLAALGAWFAFVRRPHGPVPLCAAAGVMIAVTTVGLSPHYPWYFAWLAVPAVLAPTAVVVWLASAPMLMYLDTFGDRLVWPCVVYVPALLLMLVASLHRFLTAAPIKEISRCP